jgi:hypothetical protein
MVNEPLDKTDFGAVQNSINRLEASHRDNCSSNFFPPGNGEVD